MRKRLALGWVGFPVLALLVGCGPGGTGGMTARDWATVGAYQDQVTQLQTQTSVLLTAVPRATPEPALGAGWKVTIATATRRPSVADPSAAAPLQARGVYVVLRLAVVNAGLEPAARFPWWNLRLRDAAGRLFTPQEGATLAYVASDRELDRPEAYQPGLTYREAVVFDVPPDASGWRLQADDGSLDLAVPMANAASPSPAASPAAN
ncbi:MAG TPA: hypothetical protein VFQ80_09800 [Thermomicrobiales bacterium]|jgi:hypothetical protein|nr:hypothetical protein [Thermomicrobiales bacterium]